MNNGDMPAGPVTYDSMDCRPSFEGLTKREEFAARAMQALIPIYWDDANYGTAEEVIKCMMESACEHADALLKELEK